MNKRIDKQYVKKVIDLCSRRYIESSIHTAETRELLKTDKPHLFLLGCVMDSQIDVDRAWSIPFIIADELGSDEFSAFLSKDKEWYISKFNELNLHRFNNAMGEAFYLAIRKIHDKYNDDASNIWNDNPSSGELICRLLEFKKVGVKIATMTTNILSRDKGVKLKDKYAIDISPDIHVKRVMYRLGFIEEEEDVVFSKISASKVTYAARSINPTFPGVMDLLFWEIGEKKICENKRCHKGKCPFGGFCIRQGIKNNQK